MSTEREEIAARGKEELLLEESIGDLERELTARYCQLGKEICEITDRKITGINRLVDRLVESKLRLTQLRGQTVCAHCLFPNPRGNAYCGMCGRALEEGGGAPHRERT